MYTTLETKDILSTGYIYCLQVHIQEAMATHCIWTVDEVYHIAHYVEALDAKNVTT